MTKIETDPLKNESWVVPDIDLAGQFCNRQVPTKENPYGTDCLVSMVGAIVTKPCIYNSIDQSLHGIFLNDIGTCSNFEPRIVSPDPDLEIQSNSN